MQASGSASGPGAAATAIPQLNSQQIQQLVQAARNKRDAGAVEASDPEYARMLSILRYYTQQAQQRAHSSSLVSYTLF